MNRNTRSTTRFFVAIALYVLAAAFISLRLLHGANPNARFWNKVYLVLCGLFIISEIVWFLRREKRSYFEKEMDHRRSLAKRSR